MNFVVQQTELYRALSNLVRNINKNFSAYTKVEIKVVDGKLQLTTTDGNIIVQEYIDGMGVILDETPIAVNVQNFYNIVSKLDGAITFDNGLITCKKHKIRLEVNTEINFKDIDLQQSFYEIEFKELKKAMQGCLYACDKTAQNILSGICLNGNEIVAIDGNRLVKIELKTELPFGEIIIPEKMANEIIKTFDGVEKIRIALNGNKLVICSDKTRVMGSLLQGTYPKYKQLISEQKYQVELDKNELLEILDLLSIANQSNSCYFDFADILTVGNDNSSSEIEIDCPTNVKIWFNINYVISALKNITKDKIAFCFTGALSPCTIIADEVLALIMPIKK